MEKGQKYKNMINQKVALKCMTDVPFYSQEEK